MPDYNIQMDISGYPTETTDIFVSVIFSNGSILNNSQQPFTVPSPGQPVSVSLGPITLSGSESFWATFQCLGVDGGGLGIYDVKAIGPYLVSESATPV